MGMRVESERDSAELRGDGKPSNCAIRQQEMAAGASSGSRFDAGVVDGKARGRTEPNRKVGKERVEWIGRRKGRRGCGKSARSDASVGRSRRRRNGKDGSRRRWARETF
jgi:hypothetical protein